MGEEGGVGGGGYPRRGKKDFLSVIAIVSLWKKKMDFRNGPTINTLQLSFNGRSSTTEVDVYVLLQARGGCKYRIYMQKKHLNWKIIIYQFEN